MEKNLRSHLMQQRFRILQFVSLLSSSPSPGRQNSQLIDNWRRITNVNAASMTLNNLAKPEDTEYAYSGCETNNR